MTTALPTRLVETEAVLTARRRAEFAVEHRRMALFRGPSGAGKSTAKDDCIEHIAAVYGLRVVDILLPARSTTKDISIRLFEALNGRCPDLTGYRLTDLVIERLLEQPTFVCFDEAQHLSLQGMEQISYIWERSKFPGLVVGDTRLSRVLAKNPQLESRMAVGVRFETLEDSELHIVVRTFHPALAAASDQTLRRIERALRGNLRSWRTFAELWEHNKAKAAAAGAVLSQEDLLNITLKDFVR
jgi:DNA transposition AAA+ family ATPase